MILVLPRRGLSRPETVAATEDKARNGSMRMLVLVALRQTMLATGTQTLQMMITNVLTIFTFKIIYYRSIYWGQRVQLTNNLKTTCGCNVIVRDETSLNNQRRNKSKT